jgi:hypothetical protein
MRVRAMMGKAEIESATPMNIASMGIVEVD